MSQNIKKVTTYLFTLRVLRTFLSVVTLIFSAKYFGVSIERDIWILASTLLVTVNAAIWGPINETFRTKFIFIQEKEGQNIAIRKTSSLLGFMIIVTLILSILIVLLSSWIATFVTSALPGQGKSLFVIILFMLLPSLLINQITSLGISILNAYNVYYIPEVVGFFTGIINLAAIILLAPTLGIYSLILAQYLGIILLLLIILYYLKKKEIPIWKTCFNINYKYVKGFLIFALPFFFPYLVGQCNTFVEKWLAGLFGPGMVSALDYSRQFTTVLQIVLSSVLTTVMVPMMAKAFSKKEFEELASILKENIQISFAIMCLVIPILFGAAKPLCTFFFLRGDVSVEAVDQITTLTRLYSASFVGIMLYLLTGLTLLSCNLGKKYAFWGVLTQLIILVINSSLYKVIGIDIFPISLGITHLFTASIMLYVLKSIMPKVIFINIAKYTILLIVLCLSFLLFNNSLKAMNPVYQLLINGFAIFLLVPLIAKGMGINIRSRFTKLIRK